VHKRDTPTVKFDFRRPDRVPKSQVRAIHQLHDSFVRTLASSLSTYLHTYLTVNLVSVEQLSYAEFLDGLPAPTCIVSLGLRPYDGSGVLELNPSLFSRFSGSLPEDFPGASGSISRIGKNQRRIQLQHAAASYGRRPSETMQVGAGRPSRNSA